jgi:RNA polymerase sigma factor for flagellar operon FliA
MSAVLLGKRCAGGVQDGQYRIALNDEQNFERLLETAVPLVRPLVRRIKRRLPRNFEADELESVAVTGLLAAARDYRALQDGNFAVYAVPRIRGAILDELRRSPRATHFESRRLDLAIAKLEHEQDGKFDELE